MNDETDLAGKRITVMGLGRFGGGAGVTRWLVEQGAEPLVTDLDPAEKLADSLRAIEDLTRTGAVKLRLGEHNVSDFTDTDLIIANPAVPKPWDNRFLRAASAARIPITTEIRLLVERLPTKNTIAITGTAGKSTTGAMIAHVLKPTRGATASAAEGRRGDRSEVGRAQTCDSTVFFGGNIGGSLLPELPKITPDSWVILEVSSAMLHWLSPGIGYPEAQGWSPHIAVITNIAPNHIDWHGTFEHYRNSKLQILRDQQPTDHAVLHASLPPLGGMGLRPVPPPSTVFLSPSAIPSFPLKIPGKHNRLNAAFALAATKLAGIDEHAAQKALATFPGLPDRLQFLGEFSGVRAYNDSKSTTPESAVLAIEAMEDDPAIGAARVHLICGGYDKKVDLAPMAAAAARCAGAYTIGATGVALAASIAHHGGEAHSSITLDKAVRSACAAARPGDAILLSPGCASWDQFTNYEERGRAFATAVLTNLQV